MYVIGKNKQDNWRILNEARDADVFFHLSSFSSCYVILKEEFITDENIQICARLCKENTKYKHLNDIMVDMTVCSNVKRGENVGEVYYKSNRKVFKIKV